MKPQAQPTHRAYWVSFVLLLAVAMTWTGAPAASAEESPAVEKSTPEQARAFQAKMYSIVDRLDALVASRPGGKMFEGSLQDARAILAQMSLEDFAYVSPALARDVAALENQLFHLNLGRGGSGAPRSVLKSTGLPDAAYPDEPWGFSIAALTDTPSGNEDSTSNAGVCSLSTVVNAGQSFTLMNLGFVADALADTANRLCDQIIVVAGAGANAALLCIVTEILRAAANGIVDHELLCADIVTAAEVTGGYERIGHVHDDLETVQTNLTTEIDANETKLIDLAADLVAHDQHLSAEMDEIDVALGDQRQFLESFRALMLQLDVEMHLAETSTGPIASFGSPASYLDSVADVVEAAIAGLFAADQGIGHAQRYFDDAGAAAAAGDYDDALALYGRAYREAVK